MAKKASSKRFSPAKLRSLRVPAPPQRGKQDNTDVYIILIVIVVLIVGLILKYWA